MQTFLVSYDLRKNATFLDNGRLFKQLLEGTQILRGLTQNKAGWKNHPALVSWKGHERGLFNYIEAIWEECKTRGIAEKSQLYPEACLMIKDWPNTGELFPAWWGREDILSSHRSRLLCKGEIDGLCALLKKERKIKSINSWCKAVFAKEKNMLKHGDITTLKNYIAALHIPLVYTNYYTQFNWTEDFTQDYVWGCKVVV